MREKLEAQNVILSSTMCAIKILLIQSSANMRCSYRGFFFCPPSPLLFSPFPVGQKSRESRIPCCCSSRSKRLQRGASGLLLLENEALLRLLHIKKVRLSQSLIWPFARIHFHPPEEKKSIDLARRRKSFLRRKSRDFSPSNFGRPIESGQRWIDIRHRR